MVPPSVCVCATSRGRAESKLFDFLFCSRAGPRKCIEIVGGNGEGSPRAAGGRYNRALLIGLLETIGSIDRNCRPEWGSLIKYLLVFGLQVP